MRNDFLIIKRSILYTVSIVLLLAGCGPQENPRQLKAINESLERANDVIRDGNRSINEELMEMKEAPHTTAGPTIWYARANQIHLYVDSIRTMIKDLKSELMTQSDSLKREYVTVVKQLYEENGVGYQLLEKLAVFKSSILAVIFPREVTDDQRSPDFKNREINYLLEAIPLLPGYRDSLPANEQIKYRKKWLDASFARSSSLMAMLMLNKIDNDVLTTEKILVDYCDNHVSRGCVLYYNKFSVVAVLSSSYVKNGQPIEVSAGIGSFSAASKPTIIIDGKEITLNEDATALYKFKATGSPGKHTIPVKFEYTKPDGSEELKTVVLNYIIADEK